MRIAAGRDFDVMMEGKSKDISLLKLRPDLLRFAPDVAARCGIYPEAAARLAADERALDEGVAAESKADVDEGAALQPPDPPPLRLLPPKADTMSASRSARARAPPEDEVAPLDAAEPVGIGEIAVALANRLNVSDVVFLATDDARACAVQHALSAAARAATVVYCPSSDALPGEAVAPSLPMPVRASRRCAGCARRSASQVADPCLCRLRTRGPGSGRADRPARLAARPAFPCPTRGGDPRGAGRGGGLGGLVAAPPGTLLTLAMPVDRGFRLDGVCAVAAADLLGSRAQGDGDNVGPTDAQLETSPAGSKARASSSPACRA